MVMFSRHNFEWKSIHLLILSEFRAFSDEKRFEFVDNVAEIYEWGIYFLKDE